MDLQTLRDQVRDLLSESSSNLSDSTLNDLIERCRQRAEADFADDYGTAPRFMMAKYSGQVFEIFNGVPIPPDCLRIKTVKIGNSILRYVPIENVQTTTAAIGSTVDLDYLQSIPNMTQDTDTNWLLDNASRVYVYGTALEYAYWNREPEGRVLYDQAYREAVEKTARAFSYRPSGGFKRSRGREYGAYSIKSYSETQEVIVIGNLYQ